MIESAKATTPPSNIRYPLWSGVQEVSGLWFPTTWLAPELRVARMLAAWHPGCRAYRFPLGDALCFVKPQRMVCAAALGLPLCRLQGGLYSGPLTPIELAAASAFDIGVVQGGQLVGLRFDQALSLDLSEAINVSEYALHDTYDCRVAAPVVRLPELDGKSVRGLLGEAIPPRSKEGDAFLRKLKGERTAASRTGDSLFAHGAVAARDGMLGMMYTALFKVFPGLASTTASGTGVLMARQSAAKPHAWREKLARLAAASRVAKVIGYRQGVYLRRMMEMFDKGDLDEALRNALPLDGLGQSLGQAFGAPKRRGDLRLSSHASPSTNISLGEDLQQHLRKMYRSAFEKFDRQGKIDEAVFVLAELLNARQEALDYLSKQDRHAQAAELALGWDMPAAMIIRLLMLAGDAQRAFQVARRDGAFPAAIQQLQDAYPALAAQLRLEWGHVLVQSGDWLGAVDAVWPLESAREQAMQWLLSAEQAGEELSARALVQRAALLPDTIEHCAKRIEILADPCSSEIGRGAMAEALLAVGRNSAALRALATSVLPAIAADSAVGRNGLSAGDLTKLLKLSNDPYLKADVPTWKAPGSTNGFQLWKRSDALALQIPSVGLQCVYDAAVLPDRCYLVALGEAGAVVLDAHGRVKQRYAVPAFQLALADSGRVALAIAPREHVSRVSRLDLVGHVVADLGVMALQYAAPAFNGIGWTVVTGGRILVVDTGKSLREVLWHVGDLPGPIVTAGFFSDCEVYLVRHVHGLQDWTYALPGRSLRSRSEAALRDDLPVMAHRLGAFQQPQIYLVDGSQVEFRYRYGNVDRKCVLCNDMAADEFDHSFVPLDLGMMVGLHSAESSRYFIVRFADGTCVATLDWPADARVSVREQPDHLLFYDSQGRLLDLDTGRSVLRHISVY